MATKYSNINGALLAEYKQDPRVLMALQSMNDGGSMATVHTPMEGIARALQGTMGGYMQGKLQKEYQGKQQDQYGAIADILAPATKSDPVTADMGQWGTLDATAPDMANPNREKIMAALSSGLLDPSMASKQVAQSLGFGEPKDPIKVGKNERLYAPGDFSKPLVDAMAEPPAPIDYNKAFLPDGTPNKAYQDYVMRERAAGRSVTNVNNNMGQNGIDYGKPSDGLAWKRDASGKVVLDDRGAPIAIPYQGGEPYRQQTKEGAASAKSRDQALLTSDVVVQDTNRLLEMNKGGAITGFMASQLKDVPGTRANDARALISTVTANLAFDKLQKMREASPTGGALGAVSAPELDLLKSSLANLEQSQGTPQFEQNVKRVRDTYVDTIHGKGTAKRLFYGKESQGGGNDGWGKPRVKE